MAQMIEAPMPMACQLMRKFISRQMYEFATELQKRFQGFQRFKGSRGWVFGSGAWALWFFLTWWVLAKRDFRQGEKGVQHGGTGSAEIKEGEGKRFCFYQHN